MVKSGERTIQHATTSPTPTGLFVKCSSGETVYQGEVIEVDRKPCRVMYLLRFPAGEPELWLTVERVTVKAELKPTPRGRRDAEAVDVWH